MVMLDFCIECSIEHDLPLTLRIFYSRYGDATPSRVAGPAAPSCGAGRCGPCPYRGPPPLAPADSASAGPPRRLDPTPLLSPPHWSASGRGSGPVAETGGPIASVSGRHAARGPIRCDQLGGDAGRSRNAAIAPASPAARHARSGPRPSPARCRCSSRPSTGSRTHGARRTPGPPPGPSTTDSPAPPRPGERASPGRSCRCRTGRSRAGRTPANARPATRPRPWPSRLPPSATSRPTPMQRDAVEHLDLGAALDHQPFHHVEAVQFLPLRGDFGQMPTRWWGGATGASLAVQGAPSFEDAVDGPHRGERFDLAVLEGLVDDLRPVEPQVTDPLQLRSYSQDQILDGGISPRGCSWGVRAIVPVPSVEPLPVSVVDPVMDGRLAHVELLGDLVLGATASDSGDDRLPTKRLPVILRLMATSGEGGFSVQETAERSGSGGTRLIGIRWHLATY